MSPTAPAKGLLPQSQRLLLTACVLAATGTLLETWMSSASRPLLTAVHMTEGAAIEPMTRNTRESVRGLILSEPTQPSSDVAEYLAIQSDEVHMSVFDQLSATLLHGPRTALQHAAAESLVPAPS